MVDRGTPTQPGLAQLRGARERSGRSREWVARQLEPPISTKTLERWEAGETSIKRWRLEQLAALYQVTVDDLADDGIAA